MTARKWLAVGAAALAALAVLLLWPQREVPQAEQVRRRVVQLVDAAEHKQLGKVMDGVSERFRSEEGWGKQDLKAVLAAQLLRGEWMRIIMDLQPPTAVSDGEVHVQGRFFFARSEAKELERLAAESVISAWLIDAVFVREEDGEWRVVSARHRRLEGADLL